MLAGSTCTSEHPTTSLQAPGKCIPPPAPCAPGWLTHTPQKFSTAAAALQAEAHYPHTRVQGDNAAPGSPLRAASNALCSANGILYYMQSFKRLRIIFFALSAFKWFQFRVSVERQIRCTKTRIVKDKSLKNNPGICQVLVSSYFIHNKHKSVCFILTTAMFM